MLILVPSRLLLSSMAVDILSGSKPPDFSGSLKYSLSKPPPDLPTFPGWSSEIGLPVSAWAQVASIISADQRGSPSAR